MSKLFKIYPVISLLIPLVSWAATINSIITDAVETMNKIIGALFVVATVIFLWGVIKFISASGDPAGREKAKGIMTWGIIGLAVMAAAWGVAQLLIAYFLTGVSRPTPIQAPLYTAPVN